ncbi:MAG: gene transfer agent family protein [Rubricella sp.]
MDNPWAGEVSLVIDGVPRRMRLTLGALAGLEAALGAPSLATLLERIEGGEMSAADVIAILRAGLRGGGHEIGAEELAAARIEGGPVAAVAAAGRLVALAFGGR